jgi:hypothetical protein
VVARPLPTPSGQADAPRKCERPIRKLLAANAIPSPDEGSPGLGTALTQAARALTDAARVSAIVAMSSQIVAIQARSENGGKECEPVRIPPPT